MDDTTVKNFKAFYDAIYPYLSGNVKIAGPVGMIISYMGTTAPSGYLACDGSWYNIGDYPKLANWMMSEFGSYSYFALSGETVQSGKFKVPDLRGEFLRGTGANAHANQGSGASVGVHQDGTEIPAYSSSNGAFVAPRDSNINNKDSQFGSSTFAYINTSDGGPDTTYYTSRPTNTSVLYCIKYEEYEGDEKYQLIFDDKERVVGEWFGKKLYQKTINVPDISSGSKNILHGISNLDRVVNLTGSSFRGDGFRYLIPMGSGAWATSISGITSTEVRLVIGDNLTNTYSLSDAYITLQYTKTS